MWFKNLQIYRLTKPFTTSPQTLHKRLTEYRFRACTSMDMFTYGWVAPLGREGSELCHVANGYVMLCARREDKIVPASVVKEMVDEKTAEIEAEQNRTVHRKEREAMRDEITHDLMRRALTRSHLTFACISPRDNWLVVDASSPKKSEELTALLRRSLGRLPAVAPVVQDSPAAVMTRWVAGKNVPKDFTVEHECVLQDKADEGCIVRCKNQDLSASEIQAHLKAGKQVINLAVNWNERLSFVLGDDLSVRRLRFDELVREEVGDIDDEDEAVRFDADFAIMTGELAEFIHRLMEVFGGEDEQAYTRKVVAERA